MPIPVKNITRIEIKVEWTDELGTGSKGFESVHELAAFLKDNPEFAKALGYVSKEERERDRGSRLW